MNNEQKKFGRIRMRFDTLSARIRELEDSEGYVVLDDGARYRFKFSGIQHYCKAAKHQKDTGNEAILSDFTEAEQKEIAAYAKWSPDPALHGGIAVVTVRLAKEILARS